MKDKLTWNVKHQVYEPALLNAWKFSSFNVN